MPPDFSFIPKVLLAILAAVVLVVFGITLYCGFVVLLWILGAIATVVVVTILILLVAPLIKLPKKAYKPTDKP